MIRNYPGFSQGISGARLAQEAWRQAWAFGTTFVYMRQAKNLSRHGGHYRLRLSDGDVLTARTVIIATGVAYQRLGIPALEDLQGRGVFYGTAASEAPAIARAERVRRRRRQLRRPGRAAPGQMGPPSDHPGAGTIAGRQHVRLPHPPDRRCPEHRRPLPRADRRRHRNRHRPAPIAGIGEHRLRGTGHRPRGRLVVLIGAQPRTEGLGEAVARDRWGFIRTGPDLPASVDARWPPARPPLPLETSLPGVFAAGDVRRGSVKRVASAVGEGAATVPLIHRHLARAAAARKPLTGQHTRRESPPAHDRDSAGGPRTLPTPTERTMLAVPTR